MTTVEQSVKKAAPGRNLGYRKWRDHIFIWLFMSSVLVGIAGLLTLLVTVFVDGWSWLDWHFITSYSSRRPKDAGIFAALMGSLWMLGMTAVFTIPIGIGTAVYLEEFAGRGRVTRLIQLNIANLAGVPSIIYGMLGLAVFVYFLNMGRSVAAGALTMTLLVLPVVIIASQEAIKAVPKSYRDAAYALGATRWQVVKTVVFPQAGPGMMSGIILALSRAIGESAPVLIISSLVFLTFVPHSPGDRFTVLPLQIFTWMSLPQADFKSIASAGIILLLIVLLSMNGIAIYIRNKYQGKRD